MRRNLITGQRVLLPLSRRVEINVAYSLEYVGGMLLLGFEPAGGLNVTPSHVTHGQCDARPTSLPLPSQPQTTWPVFISRPAEDRRLSCQSWYEWLVTYRKRSPISVLNGLNVE